MDNFRIDVLGASSGRPVHALRMPCVNGLRVAIASLVLLTASFVAVAWDTARAEDQLLGDAGQVVVGRRLGRYGDERAAVHAYVAVGPSRSGGS